MQSIAVFVNAEGFTASLKEEGVIRVYAQDPSTGAWGLAKEFEFSLVKSTSLPQLRSVIQNMVERIGSCRVFAAREVAGQLYNILEANKFNLYEVEGKPEQFLDSILAAEEEEKQRVAASEINSRLSQPNPEKTAVPGAYFLDLKAALISDPNLTSKKILLPFLAKKEFEVLEVVCGHVPKWFDSELEAQGFKSAVSKLDENEYKVVISLK